MLWLGRSNEQVTWEPAAAVDDILISNYENDVVATSVAKSLRQYGSLATTLVTEVSKQDSKKRSKMERHVTTENKGLIRLINMYLIATIIN